MTLTLLYKDTIIKMKHPIFGDDYPESPPCFAILQNSRTRQTHLWTKERGEWFHAGKDEYDILKGIARLIRISEHPQEILDSLRFTAKESNNDQND